MILHVDIYIYLRGGKLKTQAMRTAKHLPLPFHIKVLFISMLTPRTSSYQCVCVVEREGGREPSIKGGGYIFRVTINIFKLGKNKPF